jgi:hypothetical protein
VPWPREKKKKKTEIEEKEKKREQEEDAHPILAPQLRKLALEVLYHEGLDGRGGLRGDESKKGLCQ